MLGVLGVWANGGKGKASIRTEENTRLAFAEGGEAEKAGDSGSDPVRPTSVIERSGEEGCHGSRDAINAGFRRDLMMISLARIAQQNNVISETTPICEELGVTSVAEGDLVNDREASWVEEKPFLKRLDDPTMGAKVKFVGDIVSQEGPGSKEFILSNRRSLNLCTQQFNKSGSLSRTRSSSKESDFDLA